MEKWEGNWGVTIKVKWSNKIKKCETEIIRDSNGRLRIFYVKKVKLLENPTHAYTQQNS
jgi:hypothetical protein